MKMAKVTYTGTASFIRFHSHGVTIARDGATEVDDDIADAVTNRDDIEYVDPKFPVLEKTIPKIEDALETGDYDNQLDALAAAEAGGDDRVGVAEAIEERRDE